MKPFLFSLVLLVLISSAFSSYNAGGYDQVVIAGNQDPEACLLHVVAKLNTSSILFRQSVYNPNSDCTHQNLQFASLFNNSIVGNLTLAPTSNPLSNEGTLTIALFQQYNGSACVNIFPGDTTKIHICRFKYGEAYIHFFFKTNLNNEIETDWTGLWFPLKFSTVLVAQNFTNVWKASNSQNANIVGQLYSQCGGWSTNIPSASNEVFVTGTIYNSQQVNLGPLLAGMVMYSAIVHPRGAATNNYTAKWVDSYGFFANQTGNCTDLHQTFGDIANVNMCKGGCDVTFILISDSIYALQTMGFTYTGSLRG